MCIRIVLRMRRVARNGLTIAKGTAVFHKGSEKISAFGCGATDWL